MPCQRRCRRYIPAGTRVLPSSRPRPPLPFCLFTRLTRAAFEDATVPDAPFLRFVFHQRVRGGRLFLSRFRFPRSPLPPATVPAASRSFRSLKIISRADGASRYPGNEIATAAAGGAPVCLLR